MSKNIEIVRSNFVCRGFRAAVFDFDGTLSLLRRNWQDVMIPMMVDVLAETGTSESHAQLYGHVEGFVMRLNGQQTIYQMIQLADEVKQRGGAPLDPMEYKHRYHKLLWTPVAGRIDAIVTGQIPAEQMTVPGSLALLETLCARGITLYLTSGTDLSYVQNEVAVLGLDKFFSSRVYGALDEYKKFSKAMVIQKILTDMDAAGVELMGFGDGFVEVEEVKKVGGLAIGVASDEERRQGINQWKRDRLVQAGADIIIGDYRHADELLELIGVI